VTSSLVYVDGTTHSSLVDLLNCELVCSSSLFLVTGLNSSVELLDNGAELGLEHLVLESLGLDNLYALLSRLDIRHFLVLPDDLRQTNKNNLVNGPAARPQQTVRYMSASADWVKSTYLRGYTYSCSHTLDIIS